MEYKKGDIVEIVAPNETNQYWSDDDNDYSDFNDNDFRDYYFYDEEMRKYDGCYAIVDDIEFCDDDHYAYTLKILYNNELNLHENIGWYSEWLKPADKRKSEYYKLLGAII